MFYLTPNNFNQLAPFNYSYAPIHLPALPIHTEPFVMINESNGANLVNSPPTLNPYQPDIQYSLVQNPYVSQSLPVVTANAPVVQQQPANTIYNLVFPPNKPKIKETNYEIIVKSPSRSTKP
jgi:hypothetical protein